LFKKTSDFQKLIRSLDLSMFQLPIKIKLPILS